MEQDPGGPEGHCRFAPAARRQGQSSSEGGEEEEEVREEVEEVVEEEVFSNLRLFGAVRSEMAKPQQPLLTSVCGKIKRIWASLVATAI